MCACRRARARARVSFLLCGIPASALFILTFSLLAYVSFSITSSTRILLIERSYRSPGSSTAVPPPPPAPPPVRPLAEDDRARSNFFEYPTLITLINNLFRDTWANLPAPESRESARSIGRGGGYARGIKRPDYANEDSILSLLIYEISYRRGSSRRGRQGGTGREIRELRGRRGLFRRRRRKA